MDVSRLLWTLVDDGLWTEVDGSGEWAWTEVDFSGRRRKDACLPWVFSQREYAWKNVPILGFIVIYYENK